MSIAATTFVPVPLLSHDDDPHWKIVRLPFTAAGGMTLALAKVGHLIKFGAARADVIPAIGTDDAVLEGVIIDLPDPNNASDTTVAVALSGSFDKNTVKYSDNSTPVSVAGVARLRDMHIFLDAAVPGGAFAP
jgi:hypothetical protein